MKRLTYIISQLFGFTYKEANGFIIILIFMVVLLFAPFIYKKYSWEGYTNYPSDKKILDSLMARLESSSTSLYSENKQEDSYVAPSAAFTFDPNTVSLSNMKSLGIPKYIGNRVIKYREKVKPFKIKRDLLKVYDFPPDLYARLHPFILLPDSAEKSKYSDYSKQAFVKKDFTVHKFDINTADTATLDKLKGIGISTAKRIIKYRDLLGGYNNVDQVREIYKLDSMVILELQKYAYVSKDFVPSKILINEADVETLSRHPYFPKKKASIIFNYRIHHGPYKNSNELKDLKILSAEEVEKMAPYIQF